MHPVLFTAPWGDINTYGTLILLGLLVASPGVHWDAQKRGLPKFFVLDFYLASMIGGIVGGKISYLITFAITDGFTALRYVGIQLLLSPSGFVFYGAVIGAFIALALAARRYGTSFTNVANIMAVWVPFTHFVGRIGCFFAGCCYGAPTHGTVAETIGLRFPSSSAAFQSTAVAKDHLDPLHTVPLHPSQIYEAIGLLLLFLSLLALRRRPEGTRKPLLLVWAGGYGLLRFVLEAFRGDPERGYLARWSPSPEILDWLGLPTGHPMLLSTSQAVGLAMIASALVAWRYWDVRPANTSPLSSDNA